jgi:hypothetical protein
MMTGDPARAHRSAFALHCTAALRSEGVPGGVLRPAGQLGRTHARTHLQMQPNLRSEQTHTSPQNRIIARSTASAHGAALAAAARRVARERRPERSASVFTRPASNGQIHMFVRSDCSFCDAAASVVGEALRRRMGGDADEFLGLRSVAYCFWRRDHICCRPVTRIPAR